MSLITWDINNKGANVTLSNGNRTAVMHESDYVFSTSQNTNGAGLASMGVTVAAEAVNR